jgi:hypothetical protein
VAFSNVLATFTDPDATEATSDYAATITWGDGTTSSGTIQATGNGNFNIVGNHTYAMEGSAKIAVTLTHETAPSLKFHLTATTSEAPLSGTSVTATPTEGASFTGTVASFTDPDTTESTSDYTAVITWDDGTTSAGTLTSSGNGQFSISGTHTYAEEGSQPIVVTVTHETTTLTIDSTASISDAALSSTGNSFSNANAVGQSITVTLASFTDADPQGTQSDYSAVINWGDGSTSTGVIQGTSIPFTVQGTHTYTHAGIFHFSVVISDVGGAQTTATGKATIGNPVQAPGIVAVGADAGSLPEVKVFDTSGTLQFTFYPYETTFKGGVRVATGVLNGGPIVVTVPGAGRAPLVEVFNGTNGQLLTSFQAFSGSVTGGLYVATGDINGDGVADVAVGAGPGGLPEVEVFDGTTLLTSHTLIGGTLIAFASTFKGGVTVAAGSNELVVGSGPGQPPLVNVYTFNGSGLVLEKSFDAFSSSATGGVFVALGDFNGDGTPDIIVGAGANSLPTVNVFDGTQLFPGTSQPPVVLSSFQAYDTSYRGGVRVAAVFNTATGQTDIWTGFGSGQTNRVVKDFAFVPGGPPTETDRAVLDSVFAGGAFVG